MDRARQVSPPAKTVLTPHSAVSARSRIPLTECISLEHPGIIDDIRHGIQTLSGDAGVSDFLEDPSPTRRLALRVNPADRFRAPLLSRAADNSCDLILQVTAPKLTGRKRKRGSNEPYRNGGQRMLSEGDRLLHTLVHQPDHVEIEPVGHICERHRWRELPDLLFSNQNNPLLNEMSAKLSSLQCE